MAVCFALSSSLEQNIQLADIKIALSAVNMYMTWENESDVRRDREVGFH